MKIDLKWELIVLFVSSVPLARQSALYLIWLVMPPAGRLKPKGFQRRFRAFGAEAKGTRRRHNTLPMRWFYRCRAGGTESSSQ